MYAFEIPNLRFSGEAGEKIEMYRFVMMHSDGKYKTATTSGGVVGVSKCPADVGQVLEIADGIVQVQAGGAIQPGASVECNAQGKAVTGATTPIGVALTSGKENGIVTVKLR